MSKASVLNKGGFKILRRWRYACCVKLFVSLFCVNALTVPVTGALAARSTLFPFMHARVTHRCCSYRLSASCRPRHRSNRPSPCSGLGVPPSSIIAMGADDHVVRSPGLQNGVQFRFGIVSDVQYADIKDGHSFLGTPRYYRASLDGLRRAVTGWQQQQVEFGIQFGDLIDGFNPKDKSETALKSVLDEFAKLQKPVYHMIGNHCLYNLPRERLNAALGMQGVSSYYSFSPHKAWRFVVIDAYDVSMLGWPEGHPLHQQAKAILDEKNINENKNNPEGHEGPARRFVQFGGGISTEQLQWLVQQLADANAAGQRVIVCGHLPLHPGTCIGTCLLWNYEEVLQAMWDAGNVVATITGHAHNDGYAVDEHGIHHRVLNAVLETKPGKDCYGCIDVYGDRLDLVGVGELDSQNMPFADQQANNSSAREQSHVHERPEAEEAALQRQPQ